MSRIKVMTVGGDYYCRYAFYSLLSKDSRTTVIEEARNVEEVQWLLEVNGKQIVPDVILLDASPFNDDYTQVGTLRHLMELIRTRRLNCRIICCMMKPTRTN